MQLFKNCKAPINMINCSVLISLWVLTTVAIISPVVIVGQVTSRQRNAKEFSNRSQLVTSDVDYRFQVRQKFSQLPICEENKLDAFPSDTLYIPILYMGLLPDSLYLKQPFFLKATQFKCPSGAKLETEDVHLTPLDRTGDGTHQLVNNSLLTEFLNDSVVLLQDGYLSVGKNSSYAQYYSPGEYCVSKVTFPETNNLLVHIRTCGFHKGRPTFSKCCPHGMALNEDFECAVHAEGAYKWIDYLDKSSLKLLKWEKVNPVYIWRDVMIEECSGNYQRETWEQVNCDIEFHPVTDNRAASISLTRKWEFSEADVPKCFESNIIDDTTNVFVLRLCVETKAEGSTWTKAVSKLYMICMFIAASFNLFTSLVYAATWRKQNIHGRTLCSCTFALFFMQVFLGNSHYLGLDKNNEGSRRCIINGIFAQYFLIASFTWLVVVNLDLWLTFRSLKPVGVSTLKQFLTYSGLGWGFRLLITLISVSMEYSFPCKNSGVPVPDFGKQNCFVATWAQGIFVYYINAVLIGLSCVFMAFTVYALFDFKSNASSVRTTKKSDGKETFFLFFKLFVVMGLTWVFDVISWATQESNEVYVTWVIFDLYNMFSSVLIFTIFVCKKNTFTLIEETFPSLSGISSVFDKCTLQIWRREEPSTSHGQTLTTSVQGGGCSPKPGRQTHDTSM